MFAERRKYKIGQELEGKRVDVALAILEKDLSRQYLQKLLDDKRVSCGKKILKPSYRVSDGEMIEVDYPAPVKMDIEPIDLPLEIVYEDQWLLVVNKEAGVVVHPAEQGKFMGKSLVNAVLSHVGEGLKGIGGVMRPGIVHRLDKDTSGLIVIAKTDLVHKDLSDQFKNRKITKKYLALVTGNIKEDQGQILAALGRHPLQRKKRAVDGINAKEANTEFKVRSRYRTNWGDFTLVEINLHTGRTHQIRVHFQSVKHALIGDKLYGNDKLNQVFKDKLGLSRQFLHAYSLSFQHPENKKKVDLEIGLPSDLNRVLSGLEKFKTVN